MCDTVAAAARWTWCLVGCVSLWIAETLSPERPY